MDAPHALFQAVRVPGDIVIDHQVAELEVDPLTSCFCCKADLGRFVEALGCLAPQHRIHAAMNLAGRIAPLLQVAAQVLQRVAMFSEDQQFPSSVNQFMKLHIFQTATQRFEL